MFKTTLCLIMFFIPFFIIAQLWAGNLGTIVPAYFYPSGWDPNYLWNDLARAAQKIPLIVIMNPDNGPGSSENPDYEQAVQKIHDVKKDDASAPGGKVIGYVYTSYGERNMAVCKTDIDAYYLFYKIDGIFLDEMSTAPAKMPFYRELYEYVLEKDPCAEVVGNPGTNTVEDYTEVTSILNIFEHHEGFDEWIPPEWMGKRPANHFSALVYNVVDPNMVKEYIHRARGKDIGWLYITDKTLPNPWSSLPEYWENEVAYIHNINSSSTGGRGCFIPPFAE